VLVALTDAVSNLPTSPAPTAKFELKVNGYKVKGLQKADLSWSGSLSQTVDIYRDGSKLRSAVANTGKYLDNINRKASATYTYKVCEAGNATCSNSAVVSF
jgi:thermitase